MKTRVDNDLEKVLDLEPLPEETEEKKEVVEYEEHNDSKIRNQDAINDFVDVRKNLKNTIEDCKESLEFLLHLARTEESPRVFDSATNLIRALNETNKQLLETHKAIREIQEEQKTEDKEAGNNSEVKNTVFVGSAAEALEFINKK